MSYSRYSPVVVVLICSFLPVLSFGQSIWKRYENLFTPVQHYVVYQTVSPIVVDGKADEISWKNVAWTSDFTDIEGDKRPEPFLRTRVKMLWDNNYLYVFAELEEPQIWAYMTARDQIVYHDNDFEIFLDPDRDARNYFEIEVNARNTLFDLFLPSPYRNGGGYPLISWNVPGLKSAVFVDGTLNDPSDTDKKWSVEMAIPFDALNLAIGDKDRAPGEGTVWKADFSRVEWRTDVNDGNYLKRKDLQGKVLSEYNWVWSAPGLISMHYPERWGMISFTKKQAGGGQASFKEPFDEQLKKYLWLIYYKQYDFREKNGRFASSLGALDIPTDDFSADGKGYQISLVATDLQFTALISDKSGALISLNEAGVLKIKR